MRLIGLRCLPIIVLLIICSTNIAAQGINFPMGNPTGSAGTGNARTDDANFFIRNNIAGLTEIPLNDQEEQTGTKGVSDKGRWRFNGELRVLLSNYQKNGAFFFLDNSQGLTAQGSTITPNIAGEITYTSKNHRWGFGLGTYQIIDYNSRVKEHVDPTRSYATGVLYDTRVNVTDIALGGAVRLHKKFSVGGAFVFSRAFINTKQVFPTNESQILDATKVGQPGVTIGVHYRPTNYLSISANYKSRKDYSLQGSLKSSLYYIPNSNPFTFTIPAKVRFGTPTIAEGGIELKVTKKLTLAGDFRFYDYTATALSELEAGFASRTIELNNLDIHTSSGSARYQLNLKTYLDAGISFTSNGMRDIYRPTVLDSGIGIATGLERQLGNQWLAVNLAVLPGRIRRPFAPFYADSVRGRGIILAIGWRFNLK